MSRASPAFHSQADVFPLMEGKEFDDFVEDIREHGLQEPITTHRDGRIIDGRNRARACQRLGKEPLIKVFEGDDEKILDFISSQIYTGGT